MQASYLLTLFFGIAAAQFNNGTTPEITSSVAPANETTSTDTFIVTEVVTEFTTYCPEPTTIVTNNKTIVVTSATTVVITDCPCTIVKTTTSPVPPAPPAPETTSPAPPAPETTSPEPKPQPKTTSPEPKPEPKTSSTNSVPTTFHGAANALGGSALVGAAAAAVALLM